MAKICFICRVILLYIYIFLLQICLFSSLTIYFRNKQDLYLRLFPLFLLVTDVTELINIDLGERQATNVINYNLFISFEFCFYLFTLLRIISNKRARKTVGVFFGLFLLFALYNFFFGQMKAFNSRTYLVGALLVVASCIYYFFELFHLTQSVNLTRQSAFWICTGLLFFYACTLPFFGLVSFYNKAPHIIIANMRSIIYVLNILLYSFFTIGFLCGTRIRKSILS